MTYSQSASPTIPDRLPPAPSPPPAGPATAVTMYGCDKDEAVLFRTLAPGFGVKPTITDSPVCEENVKLASGSRCISIGHRTEVSNSTLLALSRAGVEYVSTRSVGCNHLDVRFAERVGITVGTVAYSPDSVADYTLMLMLMALRQAKSMVCRTEARDYRLGSAPGKELRDLTVGVIGTGRIGTAVVNRLKAFGCRVLAHDDRPGKAPAHLPLDEVLRRSDVITLHIPLSAETHHLLDRERIGRLREGAFVVNTARGPLVDTEALIAALESGRLGGAALDVLEGEEGIFYTDRRDKPIENRALLRLQRLPNVLVSPHAAYYTEHALPDMVENTLVNCSGFERGGRHHG